MDLSKYYAEIVKENMISKEEESALFAKYYDTTTSEKEKEKIRHTILKANLRFVFKTAKMYSRNDPSCFEDYISAGNEGLLVAFHKYNPSSGNRFLSYAGFWVMQRILHEMSHMRIVSIPNWKQQLSARIEKVRENNEKITLEELKKEFPDIKEKYIEELFSTRYLTFYIEDMDENEFEIDPIGEQLQVKMDDERVWKAVASLPSPHREIISKLFGLDGDDVTVAGICKQMKLPKTVIRQIRQEGLDMLRDRF